MALGPSCASITPCAPMAKDVVRSPFVDQQLRSLMANAMRQLPIEHRAVIYRAYYQGWTTVRIADDLGITEGAVKSLLHDGLRTLRLTVQRMGRGR